MSIPVFHAYHQRQRQILKVDAAFVDVGTKGANHALYCQVL